MKSIHFILTLIITSGIFSINSAYSQTRNLHVEGDGDQLGVIQALSDPTGAAGSVGLELIRGDANTSTDWRIYNETGNFRIQSETDNFLTNGTNRFSILENGSVGIGCTNPSAKLSICNGEIGFSNPFGEAAADKISIDGHRFDQPDMVGLGYETSVINFEEISDLYFKSEGAHRWYSSANADLGVSSIMVLDREGNLGLGTHMPDSRLQITDGADINVASYGYFMLGESSSLNLSMDNNDIQVRNDGNSSPLNLQFYGGDLDVVNGGGDFEVDNGTIFANGSTNMVGIGTLNPEVKLHVRGGSDVGYIGGGYIQLGQTNATNLGIDDNEILARNNNAAADLFIQKDGGNLILCGEEQGQVSIGITDAAFLPDSEYLLAVDGSIIAEEVRVEMSGLWPDYVFKSDYDLRTIEEMAEAIEQNGHLPGIPSATEVETEGIKLGDMQKRMMEKIEELSLYIIQLNGENKELRKELSFIKEELLK